MRSCKILSHENDLPENVVVGSSVAIDTETGGLNLHRDRLCVIQLAFDDGSCHIVQIKKNATSAPNLQKILTNVDITKIFHFGRFDIAILYQTFGVLTQNVYCTKIASKLVRTYTEKHGLKTLCRELIGVEISKEQQSSDWAANVLSEAQKVYASQDVIYLHDLMKILNEKLHRENRYEMAEQCFKFLPYRALLDCKGWNNEDIFAHI